MEAHGWTETFCGRPGIRAGDVPARPGGLACNRSTGWARKSVKPGKRGISTHVQENGVAFSKHTGGQLCWMGERNLQDRHRPDGSEHHLVEFSRAAAQRQPVSRVR